MAGEALQGVVAGEVGRLLCKLWDDDGTTDEFLSRTYGRNGAAIVGAPVRYSKRIFGNAFCDPNYPDPDRPGDAIGGLPIPGGQCEAEYRVLFRWRRILSDGSLSGYSSQQRDLYGPISIARFIDNGPDVAAETEVKGLNQDGSEYYRKQTIASSLSKVQTDPITIVRRDGQPDDCGTSADSRPRYEGPVLYPDGVSRPTTIIINNPQDNKGGRGLTIPFAWISPELNLNGKATINAEGNLEIDTNGGDDSNFSVDPNSPQPAPGPDSPPNPEGYREMRGVVVVTTKLAEATTTTEYGNGDSPNLYLPRCASLLFAVNVIGKGNWTQPVDVETLRQWVPVLGDLPAYLAVAKPMNGDRKSVV